MDAPEPRRAPDPLHAPREGIVYDLREPAPVGRGRPEGRPLGTGIEQSLDRFAAELKREEPQRVAPQQPRDQAALEVRRHVRGPFALAPKFRRASLRSDVVAGRRRGGELLAGAP